MLVLTWLVFAGLATAAGFAAVGLVGQGLDLTAAPAGPTSTAGPGTQPPATTTAPTTRPTTASPTTTTSATSTAVRRTVSRSVRGNFVSATCRGSSVTLSASPAPGWRLDDYRPGPGREARAKFRSDSGEVEFKVSCSGGTPVFETKDDAGSGKDG
jgi:hypothetical protein